MVRPNIWEILGLVLAIAGWCVPGAVWANILSVVGFSLLVGNYLVRTVAVLRGGLPSQGQVIFGREPLPHNEAVSAAWERHTWWAVAVGLVAVSALMLAQTPRIVQGRFGAVPDDKPIAFSSSPQAPLPDRVDVVKVPEDVRTRSRQRPVVIVPEKTEPSDGPTEMQPVEDPPPVQGVGAAVAPAATADGTDRPRVPAGPTNLRTTLSPTPPEG